MNKQRKNKSKSNVMDLALQRYGLLKPQICDFPQYFSYMTLH